MSLPVIKTTDTDGMLRYSYQDLAIRVSPHRRNGTKKSPVELLYQGNSILSTDANLRELRDLQTLATHADALQKHEHWHRFLVEVTKHLQEQAEIPWAPVVRNLAGYTVEKKEYLWYPTIPRGEPVAIEGDPGCGKSAVLVKLLCHLTSGARFPTLFPDHPELDFAPRRVLLFTYEDDPNSTIKPRVLINGGDPTLVDIVEGKRDPDSRAVVPMTLADLPLLQDLLTAHTPALVAFDPLQSFFGAVDMNNASETRPILDAVRNLCKAHGCTPLYIRHNGKSQRSKAIHASLGSVDITGNMRSVLSLYKDPEEPTRRILAHTKTNGPLAPSMQLQLQGATYDDVRDDGLVTVEDVRVSWDGKSDLTSDDLNAREAAPGDDPQEARCAMEQARDFLREALGGGRCRSPTSSPRPDTLVSHTAR